MKYIIFDDRGRKRGGFYEEWEVKELSQKHPGWYAVELKLLHEFKEAPKAEAKKTTAKTKEK